MLIPTIATPKEVGEKWRVLIGGIPGTPLVIRTIHGLTGKSITLCDHEGFTTNYRIEDVHLVEKV